MKNGAQTRLLALLLAILTLAAAGLAAANLVQEAGFVPPTDGAPKVEVAGGLEVYMVPAGTPADRAGLRAGDILTAINDVPTPHMAIAERLIEASGTWSKATYTVIRHPRSGAAPASVDIPVILEPSDRTDHQVMRLIALVYLAIGLYVLFRRWTAPKSTHFYIFCLVSFILYAFKYTAVFDGLDLTVLTANIVAAALQPALFLHFAISFSVDSISRRRRSWLYAFLYVPGAALATLRYLSLQYWSPTQRLQHRLDKIDYAYLATYYVLAAVVFWVRYHSERKPLERQQLKWLSRGTLLTTLPFTAIYVVPFLMDWNVPRNLTNLAVLALIFLPLTFSWAIVRYRLMDVDLIFKRGVTYTLVTAALVGLYFGVVALAAEAVHNQVKSERFRDWALIVAVIVTGLVFDPLKRMVQARVDRVFDRKKIDYRASLVEFGRELNAQTDLRMLIDSTVERLRETLLVTRVALFLAQEYRMPLGRAETRFCLAGSHGLSQHVASTPELLDLEFLDFDRRASGSHLFFENPQAALLLAESERRAVSALDLNYFVPCRAARHEGSGMSTIAVVGLGRTSDGDFLSSEDMELLESLAGYIGIAIQNAQLYQRLEQKITDFERLRDFNENIVESINIGVFAVDLNDCIESWNAQMEVMYATARADALRKPLSSVFPPEFLAEFDRLRGEHGASTLYKFRLPTPAGEARVANITIAPLLDRDFRAVGRIILVDDMSDRVNMETQLTQAEKLSSIGLLAAGVAHEVNTPLAVISSYAQMLGKQLRADDASQARLQPVLDKIIQQSFRASEIANGLLNFSRMGTTEFARVDVNATVHDTVLLLEHQMRSAGIAVETELAGDLPAIHGNRGKLQQVLVNLVLNAKDALQEKGRGTVRIATTGSSNGQSVEIRVEDDGCGMTEDVMRKIYDPFFTTKLTPKVGQRKGTGLGMAVTYGIVQEHNGTIQVSSVVETGTTFRLQFPAMDAGSRAEMASSGSAVKSEESKVVHA